MVFTINWSQPILDFFVSVSILIDLSLKKKEKEI